MSNAGPLLGGKWLQRKALLPPGFNPSQQWTHTNHAPPQELKRRPGARRFVWSRTVQDHVLVARDLILPVVQFIQVDPDRARQF